MNTKEKLRRLLTATALRDVFHWGRCVRGPVALICILSVALSLLGLGLTLVIRELTDAAVGSQADSLWHWGGLLIVLIVLDRGLSLAVSSVRMRAGTRLQMEMQRMVTDELLGKEYASLKPFHSGELVNRVFSDVGVVRNGIMGILPGLMQTAVSFVGAAVILIRMDWRFVPVLIAAGTAGVGLTAAFRNPMKRRHKRMQEAEDALHASTQETLENIRVIKASVSEERAKTRMEEDRVRLNREQIRNGQIGIAMNQGMGVVFDFSWLVCNLWGCLKIFQGEMSYGGLTALIALIGRIQAPIANAVSMVGQVYGVVASAERLKELIGLPEEGEEEPLPGFDEIRLENVSFQYDERPENVLTDVCGVIRRGDFAAVTGISGGGKTSLFQLLLGIYRPVSGEVLFTFGNQIRRAGRGTRRLFAYVPQGNTLFSGTLRENLTRFTDHATEEEILDAVRAACLEGLVAENGMDAMLGERGIGLSEGQAQRVAIARALLSGAPILLLDEATSALDEETEARLLTNIGEMKDRKGGRTCLIVTHRPAALAICDYRLEIRDGRMTVRPTEQGKTGVES